MAKVHLQRLIFRLILSTQFNFHRISVQKTWSEMLHLTIFVQFLLAQHKGSPNFEKSVTERLGSYIMLKLLTYFIKNLEIMLINTLIIIIV